MLTARLLSLAHSVIVQPEMRDSKGGSEGESEWMRG